MADTNSKGRGRGRGRGRGQKQQQQVASKPGGLRKEDKAKIVAPKEPTIIKETTKDQAVANPPAKQVQQKQEIDTSAGTSIHTTPVPSSPSEPTRKRTKTKGPREDYTPSRPKQGYAKEGPSTVSSSQTQGSQKKHVLPTPPGSVDSSPTSEGSGSPKSVSTASRSTPTIITPPRSTGTSPGNNTHPPVKKLDMQMMSCPDPPPRPPLKGSHRPGRPIELYTNHFKLQLPRDSCIYHYDVTISPAKCPPRINREVIWHLQERYKANLMGCKLAFDGKKNIYTSKRLPIDGKVPFKQKFAFKPSDEQKEREFEVEMKFAALVSLDVLQSMADLTTTKSEDHQRAIQALDIITRSMSSMRFTTVGRSFFSSSNSAADLGQGRVAWFGRYQSVRPEMWGMVLNVDVSATAFYKEQPVLNFMAEVLTTDGPGQYGGGGYRGGHGSGRGGRGGDRGGRGGGRGGYMNDRDQPNPPPSIPTELGDRERIIFAKEIKGLRVRCTHLDYPRKYKVKGVTKLCALELTFDCEGKKCTVANYFKNQYKKILGYPRLPCLHMEGKNTTIYIPIEFCAVMEQNCNRKLTPEQTSVMIRKTAKPANERKQEILQKLKEAELDKDEVMNDFGLKVYKEMASITGRVLVPPKLIYDQKREIQPANGQWDMRSNKFVEGITITRWGIIVCPRSFDERPFINALCQAGRDNGMNISCDPEVRDGGRRMEDAFKGFRNNPQLIVVILDHSTSYNSVKRIGDNMMGVVTQCVKSKNARKTDPATMSNICLKINTKLGGVNSFIDPRERTLFSSEPIIIFGADVTHPAPGDTNSPSLAAVTASMDENFMEYRAIAKVLRHRQEVMEAHQLTPILKSMLLKFYRRNGGSKPTRILFYRDGVSEGQFKEVIIKEIDALQKACAALDPEYKPGITFLVVQKRHHTRLFPKNRQDECGRSKNIPPGTVVDTVITHPREFDFFLCSHAGIQGTSKPCYYHVLWDDNNFTEDGLQKLTFQLCHCYARCTRSVSYPAPTYYSHLVAFRARYHLQDWEEKNGFGSDSASTVSYNSDELQGMEEAIKLNKNMQDTMYFM